MSSVKGAGRRLAVARQAGRRSAAGLVLLIAGGEPDGHDRPGSPGPAHTAPTVLLGRQVLGVGVDKQLFEHRVHDVPLRVTATKRPWHARGCRRCDYREPDRTDSMRAPAMDW